MKQKNEEFAIYVPMVDSHPILKKYIKKLIRYRKVFGKNFKKIKIYLLNFDGEKVIYQQFEELLEPIFSGEKEAIYSKAYDLACDYLDSFFYGKNLCDFCNNKCGYRPNFELDCGCCRHFEKHKQFGFYLGEKLVPCEYLGEDGHCTIKCLCCKLMTCEYLNKKGIRFKQKEIFPLDSTFNWMQKLYVKCIAYTPKEKLMKGILFFSFRFDVLEKTWYNRNVRRGICVTK
ncbi:MAG: hypothetical protein IJ867_02390 [Clostridia bacterium]|nr:hypothetical protein [Clostridia bacterium]